MGHDIIDESLDEETDNDNWSDISDPLPPPGIDMDSMTCVTSSKCWKEDVWTGLPYVRVQKEMGVIATGVMMDDQRVMMINVSFVSVLLVCCDELRRCRLKWVMMTLTSLPRSMTLRCCACSVE
jgi:hypothetical protein